MEIEDYISVDRANVWHPFSPLAASDPIFVKKAKGVYLHTEQGKILDAISSWWVTIHGHGNKKIAKAIAKQARRLEQVIFAGFTHEPAVQLSELLLELLPDDQDKIFFSDNGSTSTEVAIKLAIQYWANQGKPRKRIIAIEGAYHGDTFGAMSVGDRGIFNEPFFDYLFDVDFIPFPEGDGSNSIEAMKSKVSGDTAAFIYEPLVQGAAGMRMYEVSVLNELLDIAQQQDVICIADEVMTGFGRTGSIFASDQVDNKPDIYCLSKGITGGFLPMGVTSVNKRIAGAFDPEVKAKTFFHGHSYTANPMACAAAVKSTKMLRKDKCLDSIQMIADHHKDFLAGLKSYDCVEEAKSTGTILRIELKAPDGGYVSAIKDRIYEHFLSLKILLRPLGNVIYLIPPYVIKSEELERIYEEIVVFLDQLESE